MKWNSFLLALIVLVLCLSLNGAEANRKKKLKVDAVTFEGNKMFGERSLRKVMITRPSGLFSAKYYYPEVFDEDIRNLRDFYRDNGYFEAIVTEEVITDSVANKVRIRIRVTEGELTRVEDISILGNTVFTDEQILEKIKIRRGEGFKRTEIEEATRDIVSLYANNGFLDAEVKTDLRVSPELHKVSVDFAIGENLQYIIADIDLKGVEKTKPKVVFRELLFHGGEVVDYSRLLESQRRLYLTGLFQNVYVHPQPAKSGDPGKKDIAVEIKENMSIEFGAAVGYDSIDKVWQQVEAYNINLSGTARKIGLTARRSAIMRGLETSFTEPRTFGTGWRTDINFSMEYNEEPGFDFTRTGGRVVMGRPLTRNLNLSFLYGYKDTRLKNIRVGTTEGKSVNKTHSFAASMVYDTRDNLLNPSKGLYLEWDNELGRSLSNGQTTLFRSIGRFKYFYPWRDYLVFASALEVGWIGLPRDLGDLPLNERFYAGGPNSLRAFGYRLVGPLDINGVPIGGKLKIVWNVLEVRRVLYKMFSVAFFTDVGNVWKEANDFNVSDIRTCVGVGLRANTIIGVIRCDYGINIKPRKEESGSKLFLSSGFAF